MIKLKNNIANVYCVGRNYKLHAAELGNSIPTKPMFFMKPNHALVEMNGDEIQLPSDQGSIHYEAELVIHISKCYHKGSSVEDIVNYIGLGIDFTLRDLQSTLKAEGLPWLAAKGFRNSALISSFIPLSSLPSIQHLEFTLQKNGECVQYGRVEDMIFSLQEIIDFCGEHYGLGAGDVIFTGTPAGVGALADGDYLVLKMGDTTLGESKISLK